MSQVNVDKLSLNFSQVLMLPCMLRKNTDIMLSELSTIGHCVESKFITWHKICAFNGLVIMTKQKSIDNVAIWI
jgi:hypothetical protein